MGKSNRIQKYFGEDDFYVLTPLPEEPQQGEKCCGKHKGCTRIPDDARRIRGIKGRKK